MRLKEFFKPTWSKAVLPIVVNIVAVAGVLYVGPYCNPLLTADQCTHRIIGLLITMVFVLTVFTYLVACIVEFLIKNLVAE